MRFAFAAFGQKPNYDPSVAIGVDGLPSAKLCLSHWPGNTTPPDLRHDLSTGIGLAFARLSETQRRERFGRLEVVVNDHFDCDGLLCAFACLNPAEAIPRSEAMLLAARAGDYWCAPTPRAVAFDTLVSWHTDPEKSPLGKEIAHLGSAERNALAYADLLGRMPQLLDDPWKANPAIGDEVARVEADLLYLRSGGARAEWHPAKQLAVLRLTRAIDARAALEFAACDRVLELRETPDGTFAELRVSSRSWFDFSKERMLPRPDLGAHAERMQQQEKNAGRWLATDGSDPFPILTFGDPGGEGDGFRADTAVPRPSSIRADAILRAALEAL
jgi:hypothetical protein